MRNQVDFAKSILNSEINLKYILCHDDDDDDVSPYNVFSFTNYHKEHFKPWHLFLVLKNVFVRVNEVKLFTVVVLAKSTLYNLD